MYEYIQAKKILIIKKLNIKGKNSNDYALTLILQLISQCNFLISVTGFGNLIKICSRLPSEQKKRQSSSECFRLQTTNYACGKFICAQLKFLQFCSLGLRSQAHRVIQVSFVGEKEKIKYDVLTDLCSPFPEDEKELHAHGTSQK